MDENGESRVALKIVFVLSLLLVTMDIMEIYFAYSHLISISQTTSPVIFENCVKYHLLAQIFFTLFATLAGTSACFLSLGLLIDYEIFTMKFIDTFLYFNYLIFGPYLLAACCLGYYNFNLIAFTCDPNDLSKRHVNFSTVIALIICLLLSFLLTFSYSVFYSIKKLINSVRFTTNGNYYLGRVFWRYVLDRRHDAVRVNEFEMREGINENQNNLNNNL